MMYRLLQLSIGYFGRMTIMVLCSMVHPYVRRGNPKPQKDQVANSQVTILNYDHGASYVHGSHEYDSRTSPLHDNAYAQMLHVGDQAAGSVGVTACACRSGSSPSTHPLLAAVKLNTYFIIFHFFLL